ncbi:sulfur carrier protein ThiS [uncultured Roseburia sp.]|nr:sulfur carrier protein ThiS [uncultured Roseburia sp.]
MKGYTTAGVGFMDTLHFYLQKMSAKAESASGTEWSGIHLWWMPALGIMSAKLTQIVHTVLRERDLKKFVDGKEFRKNMRLNGVEKEEYHNQSVLTMLEKEKFQMDRIAVEVNGEILPKSKYNQTLVHAGDVIEVVSFVGGG